MATDKIVNPSNAEYAQNQSVSDFANGKAAMLLWQAAGSSLKAQNMHADAYGVAPVPMLENAPSRRQEDQQHGRRHQHGGLLASPRTRTAALQFVKFMTSDDEQIILNKTYGSLPSVKAAGSNEAFQQPEQKVLAEVLNTTAAPLPQVPEESQFETLVGTAMKELFADAASGKPITDDAIKAKLTEAQSEMK